MIPVGAAPLFVNRACFFVLSAFTSIAREAGSFMVEGIVAPDARALVGLKLGGAPHKLGKTAGTGLMRSWSLWRHDLHTSRAPPRGPRKCRLHTGSHAEAFLRGTVSLARLRVSSRKKLMPCFSVHRYPNSSDLSTGPDIMSGGVPTLDGLQTPA